MSSLMLKLIFDADDFLIISPYSFLLNRIVATKSALRKATKKIPQKFSYLQNILFYVIIL